MSKAIRMSEEQYQAHLKRQARIDRWNADATRRMLVVTDAAEIVQRPLSGAPAPTKPSKYPLVALCRAAGLPAPASEYRFAPPRRWRADYCWPEYRLIVEVDGGVFVQGRHSRGAGILGDMEKLNAAAILGYRVLKYVPRQLKTTAIADLWKILA